jgi:dihydroflavonol-4-reductase
LVGAHLLYDLAKAGKRVRALKRASSSTAAVEKTFAYYHSSPQELLKQVEWVEGDVTDIYSVLDAMEGVTDVYHSAAVISFNAQEHRMMEKINIDGTANMVNAALEKGIRKFCHVSSIAAIGRPEHPQIITEKLVWKNSPGNSRYSISKYGAEREVWRGSEEGLKAVVVNPGIIIGPGNWITGSTTMFNVAYKGLKFFTEGASGFVDVRDVTKAMVQLMESDIVNERFILTSENLKYRDFLALLHTELGKPAPAVKANKLMTGIAWRAEKLRSAFTGATPLITKETVAAAHEENYFSNEKIKQALGFSFIPVEQSVKETCKYFIREIQRN